MILDRFFLQHRSLFQRRMWV